MSGGADRGGLEGVEGRVELRRVATGTRSEHEGPVVVDDEGEATEVHVIGDHPYDEPTLRALVGQRVRVRGVRRNRTLRVEASAVDVLSSPGPDAAETPDHD